MRAWAGADLTGSLPRSRHRAVGPVGRRHRLANATAGEVTVGPGPTNTPSLLPSALFHGVKQSASDAAKATPGIAMQHAANTASADFLFIYRPQILWVGLGGDNEATGNPFRRGGVPMTAASIPGVAGKLED